MKKLDIGFACAHSARSEAREALNKTLKKNKKRVEGAGESHPIKAKDGVMNTCRCHPDRPSAQLSAANIKGERNFACARHDDYIFAGLLDEGARISAKGGIYARIEYYPEVIHSFAFPTHRIYQKKSAERHWEHLFHLFQRNLH